MTIKLTRRHYGYQANSLKTGTVLSYQYIELRAFRDRRLRLKKREWIAAYEKVQLLMQEPLNV